MGTAYVLYAAGSPLIVDYEDAILSSGGCLAAIVKNHEGALYATDRRKLIPAETLELTDLDGAEILIPLFTPGHRYSVAREIETLAATLGGIPRFGTLVHKSAVIASSTQVSNGSFVNAGVTVGAETFIGEHCIVNRASSIGHHVKLSSFVSIGPGATLAGQIHVGRGSVIGAGATILPGVEIGENSIVAAGAVVTRRIVPSNVIVSGNPARLAGRPIEGYGKTSVPSSMSQT